MRKSTFVSEEFMLRSTELIRQGLIKIQNTDRKSTIIYALPVPKNSIQVFGSIGASPTHIGQLNNAIDFYLPVDTPIYAAANGRVISLRDSSDENGNTIDFWDRGNFIEIEHRNGERTWYEHLKHRGIVVKVGDRIKEGSIIAYSGNTGFTENPHLHFQVSEFFGNNESDYVTLRAQFHDFHDVYSLKGLHQLIRK